MQHEIRRIVLVSDEQADYHLVSSVVDAHPSLNWSIDWVRSVSQFHRAVRRASGHQVVLFSATPVFVDAWNQLNLKRVPCPWITLTYSSSDNLKLVEGALMVSRNSLKANLLVATCKDAATHFAQSHYMELATMTDELTGLGDRSLFDTDIELLIHHHKSIDAEFGLVYIDICDLKQVNTVYSRDAGDFVLVELAQRIKQVAGGAHCYRLGSDEFVLLIEQLDHPSSMTPLIGDLETALQEPMQYGDETIAVGISIGIASYPIAGETARDLIRNADLATYEARQQGSLSRFFDVRYGRDSDEIDLISELKLAIRTGDFQLHYQPRICPKTGTVHSVEGLGRWYHWRDGWVNPSKYIPLAEQSGLVVDFGHWVLEQACKDLATLKALQIDLTLAVNMGYQQLMQHRVAEDLKQLAELYDVDLSNLEIELTETVEMNRLDTLADAMTEIAELGVSFSLDDFGTGYSAFTHLQRLPIDIIKIDREFTSKLLDSGHDRAIVKVMVDLAKRLDLKSVIEGVESERQLAIIKDLHCDLIQGYYYAHPQPLTKLLAFIARSQSIHLPRTAILAS